MHQITIIQKQNMVTTTASKGSNLLDVLKSQNSKLHTPCGGRGTCGKCKVKIEDLPHTYKEKQVLTDSELGNHIHLACLVTIKQDMTVTLLSDGLEMEILTGGHVKLHAEAAMKGQYVVGIDIGTTTVVCYLIDLSEGKIADIRSEQNCQSVFGGDVVSRLSFADENGIADLQNAICKQIEQMIKMLLMQNELKAQRLTRVVIAGNTTMIHLLCGWDIDGLCRAPFHPYSVETHIIKPSQLGMDLGNDTDIYLLAGYSAFVGSDITAAVLASELYKKEEVRLLVDIGTNGEIVIGNQDRMLCTSVAAGPAFEGGNIACGMPGFPGAIYKAEVENGKLKYYTIGDVTPVGICGSGLIDLVACMLSLDYIDETGLLADDILEEKGGIEAYFLSENVYLLPADIRAVQLAKSAVYTGIEILMKEYGVTAGEVAEFVLAGGFGSKLNPQNAAAISLFPKELIEKTVVIDNGAGMGASLVASDIGFVKTIEQITQKTSTVELSAHPDFMDIYIESMLF